MSKAGVTRSRHFPLWLGFAVAAACHPAAPVVAVGPSSPAPEWAPEPTPVAGGNSAANRDVVQIEAYYEQLRPFEAELSIMVMSPPSGPIYPWRHASLVFDRPGRMRITYADGWWTVVAGSSVSTFVPMPPALLQESVRDDYCPALVVFACPLASRFTFVRHSRELLVGTPRIPSDLVTRLLLHVDGANGVRRVVIENGATGMTIDVAAARSSVPQPDAFRTTTPEGTRLTYVPPHSLFRTSIP